MLFSIDICKGALVPGFWVATKISVRTFDALMDIGFFSCFSFTSFFPSIFVIAFSQNS